MSLPDSGNSYIDRIAKVCHEALDGWREEIGEPQIGWFEKLPEEHRRALAHGVRLALSPQVTPEDLHAYGVTVERPHQAAQMASRTWSAASEEQRKKAVLFQAIARALGCGTERWDVKTGTDADAARVNMTAKESSISELVALPAPPENPPARVAGEFQLFTIEAMVTACKIESDSDYHLALADDQGATMIAEAACPGCASGSPWLDRITASRSAIEAVVSGISEQYQDVNRKATITGVGFFDRIHGQRGVAPNGVELHPILSIEFH